MMKILIVFSYIYEMKGAPRVVFNSALFLRRMGYQVDMLILDMHQDFANQLKEEGVGIYSLNMKERIPKYLNTLDNFIKQIRIAFFYRKFLKQSQKKYNFAIVHHFRFSPIIIPFLRIPNVYFCHEPPRNYYEVQQNIYRLGLTRPLNMIIFWVNKNWDRYCVRRAAMVISNSDYSREYIYRVYGVFSRTVYPGVDENVFKKLSVEKERLILSVGFLFPNKGHHFIVKSLGLIAKEKRPKLIIVGGDNNDEEARNLYRLSEKYGVMLKIESNIRHDDDTLITLYNRASITCVASVMEPFGLVAVESMACGTPVVAVREAGLRETVTDQTGILVDRDEKEFAKAVEYLLDKPDLIEKMGEAGRKRVEKYFTLFDSTKHLEEYMLEVAKTHKC
jgi:glycosyltransferase involved in cell wall biosynthesis